MYYARILKVLTEKIAAATTQDFFVNALKIVNTFTVGSEIETERRPVKTMAILKKTLNLKPLLFQITEHETQSS